MEKLKGYNTIYLKEKWVKETGRELSEEDWEKVNEEQWKTCSLSWREYGWKNVVRYIITLAQQKWQDTRCWRFCGENKANHFHIFWDCPCIVPFWQEVNKNMEKILKLQLPFTFEVLYLGKEIQQVTRPGEKYLFRIMLVSAKKAITRKWLNKDVPGINEWIEVMLDVYRLEKLTFLTRFKTDLFKNYWKGGVDFVSVLEIL